MDASGQEFSYLPPDLGPLELARRNRTALLREHIEKGGSAELTPDVQKRLGQEALSWAKIDIDLLSEQK